MSSHAQWTLQIRREMVLERFKKLSKTQRSWFCLLFGYVDTLSTEEARSACVLIDKVLEGGVECTIPS